MSVRLCCEALTAKKVPALLRSRPSVSSPGCCLEKRAAPKNLEVGHPWYTGFLAGGMCEPARYLKGSARTEGSSAFTSIYRAPPYALSYGLEGGS